jgi:hypothetical protein
MVRGFAVVAVWLAIASSAHAQSVTNGLAGSIAGRVLRPDGIPQPEAEVVTATRGRDGRLQALQWRVRTASDGRYEIANLPAGRYLVLVRAPGSDGPMPGRPLPTLFPGVPDTEPGTAIEVFPGVPVEGIDIWQLPSPRRFQVEGRVVDAEDRAVENVSIEFGRPRTRADGVWTVTEPGGLFTLTGIPPGPLVLRARADGPSGPLIGLASTELGLESVQDLRIVVREPARVRGRIRAMGNAPLPDGLRVAIVPALLGPSALFPPDEAPVGADGQFEVSGGAGPHDVRVEGLPPGWRVLSVGPAARAQRATGPAGILLTAGATLEGHDVVVGPAPVQDSSSR